MGYILSDDPIGFCILLMNMACVLIWKKIKISWMINRLVSKLESGEIRDADALARLGLVLATTTLYLVSTGTAVVTLGLRSHIDTHWQRGLSYFQIGWRWIRHALRTHHVKYLLPFFWLEPGPDPFPVFASKRQATKPIATLFALRLEGHHEICQSIRW